MVQIWVQVPFCYSCFLGYAKLFRKWSRSCAWRPSCALVCVEGAAVVLVSVCAIHVRCRQLRRPMSKPIHQGRGLCPSAVGVATVAAADDDVHDDAGDGAAGCRVHCCQSAGAATDGADAERGSDYR